MENNQILQSGRTIPETETTCHTYGVVMQLSRHEHQCYASSEVIAAVLSRIPFFCGVKSTRCPETSDPDYRVTQLQVTGELKNTKMFETFWCDSGYWRDALNLAPLT